MRKSEKIKDCLKKGIPLATLSVVVMTACGGCTEGTEDPRPHPGGMPIYPDRHEIEKETVKDINTKDSVKDENIADKSESNK